VKGALLLVVRMVLSLILIGSLTTFVVLHSISQNIDEDNYKEILGDIAFDVIKNQLGDVGNEIEEFSTDEVYAGIISECEGQDMIIIENFEIDCNEVRISGEEGFEDLIKDKLAEEIEKELGKELERQGIADIRVYFEGIRSALIVLGVISIILVLSIFFLSVPRYSASTNLGIVALVSGLPFFFVKILNLAGEYSGIDTLENVVGSISNSLFINFFIVFVVGAILIIIGIFLKVKYSKKKKDSDKSKKGEYQ